MSSNIWSRDDIRNILLAVYASKLPPGKEEAEGQAADAGERLYQWGCRAAVQSLMLAFGLPLQMLDKAMKRPARASRESDSSTEHWWLADIENILAAVYRSAISSPAYPASPGRAEYHRGFAEVIEATLQALGSQLRLQQWQDEALAERSWIFPWEQESPVRLFGSTGDEEEVSP